MTPTLLMPASPPSPRSPGWPGARRPPCAGSRRRSHRRPRARSACPAARPRFRRCPADPAPRARPGPARRGSRAWASRPPRLSPRCLSVRRTSLPPVTAVRDAALMRFLILGGARFVSYATAAAALARGHEVVCAARGESGAVPDGATLVAVDRDRGLGPLVGQRFDAVVEVARMNFGWVRDALSSIDAAHWTFVSSVSVYATDGSLLAPVEDADPADPEGYGAVKLASENAVRATHPDAL